ncbi:hypothetical protein Rsub_01432 [Raphidocelis subcapitata]|uniref:AP2/ERF domain-containing protein n=1 Tax=Raphidocelis subcapitata TaxID=307507 RepID=A0A2V0NTR0_9CHLO|nr:hypothetical protein Rsub_01432 [Raphidocelis subcapitata]|eukprot:GBF88933.1 hypothetical protein Rsub_01432 [Raphidocelis subcapitata]
MKPAERSMHSRSYIGVYRSRRDGLWRAVITWDGAVHSVGGRFEREMLAACAYDCAAAALYGPRSAVNFGAAQARSFMRFFDHDPGMQRLLALKAGGDGAASRAATPAVDAWCDGADAERPARRRRVCRVEEGSPTTATGPGPAPGWWGAADGCATTTSSSGATGSDGGSDGSHAFLYPIRHPSGCSAADDDAFCTPPVWEPPPFADALSEGDAASARGAGGFCGRRGDEDGQLAAAQLFLDWASGALC